MRPRPDGQDQTRYTQRLHLTNEGLGRGAVVLEGRSQLLASFAGEAKGHVRTVKTRRVQVEMRLTSSAQGGGFWTRQE